MTNDPGRPFSFDDAFKASPAPAPSSSLPVEAAPPRRSSSYAIALSRSGRERRGQLLAWVSLILAVAGAFAIGFGLYFALATVELSASPFVAASHWMTLATVGLCIIVIALATSIVALVRARPRTVSVLALIATLVLPVIAGIMGIKLGVDVFAANTQSQATAMGTGAVGALEETLEQYGIDPGPIVSFLLELLG